ncbi:MAG TPA: nuclear transport factor 2 family protein [Blastocatellia bacterium]|nr:nuclear transport factor 2 family protein [Blastocatellia bacterium]
MTQASPAITAALTRWHQCVTDRDMNTLREILADDIRFHSPFLWKPKEGTDAALMILSNVVQVFEDFKYHREMTDGTTWTLEFSARVGDLALKGVDIIRFNEEGKIADFEVMIRPANALQALGAEMGRRLAAQTK